MYAASVARKTRAALVPETLSPTLSDWELREDVRRYGLLQPLLRLGREVLDGRRRLDLCRTLRIQPIFLDVPTELDAAPLLWRRHPRRALERFGKPGMSRKQLAYLFGLSPSQIPTRDEVRDANKRRRRGRDGIRCLGGLEVDSYIYDLARRNCRAHKVTLSGMVRYYIYQLAGVHPQHPLSAEENAAELLRNRA